MEANCDLFNIFRHALNVLLLQLSNCLLEELVL